MTLDNWMPIGVLLTALMTAIVSFSLPEKYERGYLAVNLVGILTQWLLLGIMLWGSAPLYYYETRLPLAQGLDLVLRADTLGMLLATVTAGLWLVTTYYAYTYLAESPQRHRFFGFLNLSLMATVGIALANNLFTLLFFYEILILTTYPLIVHRGTTRALRAGKIYLRYNLFGSALLTLGIIWLYQLTPIQNFTEGGILAPLGVGHYPAFILIFILLTLGFGVKATLVPFHSWLPRAAIAPAPVGAFLHAVAHLKVGLFGILRIVYDVYGLHFAYQLGVLTLLMFVAAFTIVYSGIRGLFQTNLKRLLAFAAINQAAYIIVGLSLWSTVGITATIMHFIHHSLATITLFLSAGNLAYTLNIHKINDMAGVGKRLPLTMAAFTVGALSAIGLPPFAGFISIWYLGMAALESGLGWLIILLIVSSLLNAAYFLPILHTIWFRDAKGEWQSLRDFGKYETSWHLLIPTIVTAILVVITGVLVNTPASPLTWAVTIATREYVP